MKKRKLNKKKIFILILLVIVLIFSLYFVFTTKKESSKSKEVKEVDNISDFGYSLSENSTKYYKSLFNELKKVLSADSVDNDKYAEIVGKMFVFDFFNLDNKSSKNDVGGTQFVYSDYVLDFSKYAMDSIYKSVLSNVYGDRKQELPIVTDVTISDLKNEGFTYGDKKDDNAYVMNFEITYKEDMGYQTSGSLVLIHSGDKLEVAQMSE